MVKIVVVFYSTYGHVYQMAQSIVKGAKEVEGAEVELYRVAETLPVEVLEKMGAVEAQKAFAHVPVIGFENAEAILSSADAIIFGTGTRFGMISAQLKTFIDSLGGLWAGDKLVGKIGSAFVSTGTQHGGQESTLLSFHTTLLHFGMIVCGLPYSCKAQFGHSDVNGSSPYGAGTIAGGDGSRLPSATELSCAEFQGRHVATLAKQLSAGRA
eukprot:TRINITY_DN828_c0_g1_i1.p1 TRINITY_DN828_c0_g1~~TRINITY_DN828_c0_g1_i1.p1  ORF type:complete len:224 (-),score=97.37 TRINITY_DN828_c0_g1_i1:101-736(-)